jgi:hypothetical protein
MSETNGHGPKLFDRLKAPAKKLIRSPKAALDKEEFAD